MKCYQISEAPPPKNNRSLMSSAVFAIDSPANAIQISINRICDAVRKHNTTKRTLAAKRMLVGVHQSEGIASNCS